MASIPEELIAQRARGVLVLPRENTVVVRKYIVLRNALEGHTGVLNGVRFEDGVHVYVGDEKGLEGLSRYCYRCWQAEVLDTDPRGSDGQREVSPAAEERAPGEVPAGVSSGRGESADGASEHGQGDAGAEAAAAEHLPTGQDGEGSSEPEAQVDRRLVAAIDGLDPANDEHWTASGKPAMAAVEALYGSAAVTRKDVEEARPGYDREAARAAREG